MMNSRIGTPFYIAPEVLEGSYDKACDMWSIGVMTFWLLVGYPPFNDDNENKLFKKIRFCDYDFEEKYWSCISEDAKQFIRGLLEPNRQKRMTPSQAINHSWISKNTKTPAIDSDLLSSLLNLKPMSPFK